MNAAINQPATSSKQIVFATAHKIAKAMKANVANEKTAYAVCLAAALKMAFAAAKADNFDEVIEGYVADMGKAYATPRQIIAERIIRETPKAYWVYVEVATYRRFDVMTGKKIRETYTTSVCVAKSQIDDDGIASDWIIDTLMKQEGGVEFITFKNVGDVEK